MSQDTSLNPEGFDAIAADEVEGDTPCSYEGCERSADWFVEVTHQDSSSSVGFYVCQPCSQEHRIYAKENELYKREVSLDGQ